MTRAASRKSRPVPVATAVAPPPPADWPMLARCFGMLIALLLLTVFAIGLFRTRLTTVGGSEMNWDRAVFFAVNAITLSGFRSQINVGDLKGFGQLIDYLLIATATLSYLLIGGWSLRRTANFDVSDFALTRFTLIVFTLATLIGGSLLIGNGVGLLQSIYDATSAFGNCGLWLGRLPELNSLKLHLVLLPLAVVGGWSMPVIFDVWQALTHRRRITPHTSATLTAAAIVYLLAIVPLWLFETIHTGSPAASFSQASALALDTRSLGHPLDLVSLTAATPWLLMLLIAVGASSAGSGGGIKSNTLWVLFRDAWQLFAGRSVGRIFAVALMSLAGYLALVIVTTVALSLAEPTVAGEQLLFTAFSGVSNCGLSQQPINFGSGGLYVVSLAMLAGRLWSIAVLLLCVHQRITSEVAVG